jgi:hypothetical protein
MFDLLMLCQLVVPVVMDFSREVTDARRLEMEDASAQGAMVISTPSCILLDVEVVQHHWCIAGGSTPLLNTHTCGFYFCQPTTHNTVQNNNKNTAALLYNFSCVLLVHFCM